MLLRTNDKQMKILENLTDTTDEGILRIVLGIVIVTVIIQTTILAINSHVRQKQEIQSLKQLAVEKGFAWYNPTNGVFEVFHEVITNR